jgi:hypothetical protein
MDAIPSFRDGLELRLRSYEAEEGLKRLSHTTNKHVDRFLLALKHLEIMQRKLGLPAETPIADTTMACQHARLRFADLPHMTQSFLHFFVREPAIIETHNAGPAAGQLGEVLQANVAALLSHVSLFFVALQDYCRGVDPDLLPVRGYTQDLEHTLSDLTALASTLTNLGIPVSLSGPVYDWAPLPDRTWDQYPHWGSPRRATETDKTRFRPYFRDASENLARVLNAAAPKLTYRPLIDLLVERGYYNTLVAIAAINPAFREQVSRVSRS